MPPARTPGSTEQALAAIWRQVLRVPSVAPDDDFFELGGDSFQAAKLAALVTERLGVAAPPALALNRPGFAGQLRWLREAGPARGPDGPPVPDAVGGPPLSTQQEDFLTWMFETEPVRDVGSVSVAVRVREELDVAVLSRALGVLAERHEALRTVCAPADGALAVSIADLCEPEVAEVRAVGDDLAVREADARALAARERMRMSDVTRGPLVRALVIRLGPGDQVMVLSVHHFVFDGWSMGVLLRELGVVYSALRAGRPDPLRPLALTYSQYCSWTRRQWARNQEYWETVLAGAPGTVSPFPGRRDAPRFRRAFHWFELDAELGGGLREVARERAATPFMAVTACWAALLAGWTGVDDLLLMSPVPGRTAPEHESVVGCLVQSLYLRVNAGGEPGFDELLDRVRAVVLGAVEHQFHPYHLWRPRLPYPSRVHYESWGDGPSFPGLDSGPFPLPRDPEELDWPAPPGHSDLSAPTLVVEERRDGSLAAAIVYNTYGYAPSVAERLAEGLAEVAAGAVADPRRTPRVRTG
ncbi:Phosphopantetheine attachment site [Thermomonospora echinospora]|uniref:Phosphopantetheine attachment site n=1 Tax=Thermomonospora echinospora TaxID=1992 RepID=A0A1H5XG33_9ACTN|nr:condensation domain-containing protein [Thermomonospora echinospora]SEG10702.1 Phosphopantetheine attachment site [Thermomonospora echinospora]